MKKIVCLFPGIGYTCDKPLLYYTRALFRSLGWEVVPVPYTGFPDKVRGDAEKQRQCIDTALQQTESILRDIRWDEYDKIVFAGKSVGTVVLSVYAREHGISCRQILFTPVEDAFASAGKQSVVFHGTKDPWADTGVIEKKCRELGIPLYETADANHSLETGDTDADIRELRKVMKTVRAFVTDD